MVEDEPILLDDYARRLEQQGFTVKKADGSDKALEAIRDTTFHIAWVDLTLQGPSSADRKGYLVVDKLKSLNEGTKIVIVTQHSRDTSGVREALRAVKEAGADDFIPKSLATRDTFNECLEKLKALLRSCAVDKNADTAEAQKNLLDTEMEGVVIGNIVTRFSPMIDGKAALKLLLAGYNAIKPVRRHKELTFEWDSATKLFRSPFWSKRLGCAVELIIGPYSDRTGDVIFSEKIRGVPLSIRTTDKIRNEFNE